MGERGPAPKPTALKKLQGTRRRDREWRRNEPRPETAAPSCPSWLHREAKREWRRIVPELLRLGLLTRIDRAALAAYCQCYAEWWEMERAIAKHGRTQVTDKGYVMARPEVHIRNRALQLMRAYLAQFGLSPASRTRVRAEDYRPNADDANPFLKLVK